MVHTMNTSLDNLTQAQRQRFAQTLDKLYQCCGDRHAYLSEKFQVPQAELRALMLLGENRYLMPKAVAQILGIAKSRVTKLVEGLMARGLVSKVADPVDSRVVLLGLTPAGQKLRRELTQAMEALRDQILGQIEPHRREVVLESLEILKNSMELTGERLD